jgi:ubiquinone/menaquinone biosynthesis C-methylase UbiE
LEVHGSWRIYFAFAPHAQISAAGVDHNRQMIPTGEKKVKRRGAFIHGSRRL